MSDKKRNALGQFLGVVKPVVIGRTYDQGDFDEFLSGVLEEIAAAPSLAPLGKPTQTDLSSPTLFDTPLWSVSVYGRVALPDSGEYVVISPMDIFGNVGLSSLRNQKNCISLPGVNMVRFLPKVAL